MSEKIEATSELIPFHGLPVYKVSSNFRLDQSEMDTIVKGEFRKAESKQGNAISKSAEVLEDERLLRVKTHILSVFNDYVVNHLQIQNQFCRTREEHGFENLKRILPKLTELKPKYRPQNHTKALYKEMVDE